MLQEAYDELQQKYAALFKKLELLSGQEDLEVAYIYNGSIIIIERLRYDEFGLLPRTSEIIKFRPESDKPPFIARVQQVEWDMEKNGNWMRRVHIHLCRLGPPDA